MVGRLEGSRGVLALVFLGALAMLAGCSSTGSPQSGDTTVGGMSEVMASWKGRQAREAVGLWGMPDTMGREGTLMMMVWKADNRADLPAAQRDHPPAVPGGVQPWPTRCTRVLGVDEQEIIRTARWFGSECSTDPADYVPPGVGVRGQATAQARAPVRAASPAPGTTANTAVANGEIPFTLESTLIVVEVEFAPGRTLPFAFDSGLSHGNIITPAAARFLGLKGTESLAIDDASGSRHAALLATVPAMRIGGAHLENQLFAIVDVPENMTRRPSAQLPPLAGFLGAPLMAGAVLCIDYDRQRLQRWPRATFSGAKRASVPMRTVHELPTVDVRIDGHPATLVVDSGHNGAASVFGAYADQHDFAKRYPALLDPPANDGRGVRRPPLLAEAQVLDLGPGAAFQHAPLAVIPQGLDPAWGIDGLLGYTVLSALDPCLDTDGQRLLYVAQ